MRAGFAALLLGVSASGCTAPCDALADKICSCRPSQVDENQCLEQVRAASQAREVSEAESMVCESALDTCTCAALESENYAACALARAQTSSVAP